MPLQRVRRWLANLLLKRVRRLPEHIAIIPDGNRRWARRRGLPPWAGHFKGYEVMKRVLDFLWNIGVRYVTIYALSRENCIRRPREELQQLYQLLSKGVDELSQDPRVKRGEVKVCFVGDMSLVPSWLVEKMKSLEAASRGGRVLNVCVCYSGRWEILEAVRKISSVCARVETEEEFTKFLPLGGVPPPDLIIRTGGELRLSNFLLWHAAYTELYFTKRYWPDFDELELVKALLSYSRRERRFGA